MRKQLMSPIKVGLKSINWYMIAITIKNNYLLLLISLNVVISMHLYPTRVNWIIIKLSKVAIRLWMNKVKSSCWNIILYSNLAKEKNNIICGWNISMLEETLGKNKGSKKAFVFFSITFCFVAFILTFASFSLVGSYIDTQILMHWNI